MTVGLLGMLCSLPSQPLEPGSIIDLEKVITEYAWRELKRDLKWYDCVKRVDFSFDVSWNFFEFDHKTTRFQLRSGSTDGSYREKKQVELFRTDFTNNTNKDQVYKLRTQRQTKAATAVAIQKGFTLKGNCNFKLKIPPEIGHFGVSASADGYLRVCRPRGETFEDTFTWQVDSDVTVESNHVTNARLLVAEDELVADFEVRTLMRMPTGEAPIIVKRKSNKEIYAVMMISDLRDVFADIDCKIINIGKTEKSESDGKRPQSRYAIEFITHGILESVRWRNQKICLQSYPIRDLHIRKCDGATMVPDDQSPPQGASYSSSVFSKVLEHALADSAEELRAEREDDKGARAKKDLRFNIIPTVISEPEETYDSPEKVLSTLIRESMSLTGSPSRSVQRQPQIQRQAHATSRIPELTEEPVIRPIIITQKETPKVQEPQAQELPSYKSCDAGVFKTRDFQEQPNISQQYSLQEHQYKSQVEHFYLRSGAGEQAIAYRPMSRDITKIAEEPEREQAASMSKQSSVQSDVQSEGTLDDATESLDSGDSRRVSKVTSV
ncbi:uncharacterized protein LOC123554216 [Mercenaria mercenaria]|uniref:uncharacterized protein LOC123554216 n=1 Tax=Mercenaria mercenaria TaxID=6596 RepID=UPI001E1D5E2C|nr:uncharacterized protein LOC123554216 [Mercenaria mercenaria]